MDQNENTRWTPHAVPRHKVRMSAAVAEAGLSPLEAAREVLRRTFGHAAFRGQGRGPDMAERIAGFQNKTVKQA